MCVCVCGVCVWGVGVLCLACLVMGRVCESGVCVRVCVSSLVILMWYDGRDSIVVVVVVVVVCCR